MQAVYLWALSCSDVFMSCGVRTGPTRSRPGVVMTMVGDHLHADQQPKIPLVPRAQVLIMRTVIFFYDSLLGSQSLGEYLHKILSGYLFLTINITADSKHPSCYHSSHMPKVS